MKTENENKFDVTTTDAQLWAKEFVRLNSATDEGTMLAWFASAIMAGIDSVKRNITPDPATVADTPQSKPDEVCTKVKAEPAKLKAETKYIEPPIFPESVLKLSKLIDSLREVSDVSAKFRDLCYAIEELPASEQQTKISTLATDLMHTCVTKEAAVKAV